MKNQSGFVWQRIKLHKSFWIVIRNSLVIVGISYEIRHTHQYVSTHVSMIFRALKLKKIAIT